jgi:hypothetical protein
VAKKQNSRVHERWAQFRFSVIGQLLAAPPRKGELRAEIEALAAQEWQHPITGEPIRFAYSTIERWLYGVTGENDPVGALLRGLGGLTLFHVPRPRWVRFPFYSPGIDIHRHIPQRLGYHATTSSAFGH